MNKQLRNKDNSKKEKNLNDYILWGIVSDGSHHKQWYLYKIAQLVAPEILKELQEMEQRGEYIGESPIYL